MITYEQYGASIGETQAVSLSEAVDLGVKTFDNLGLISDEGKAREEFGNEVASLQEVLPESVSTLPHDIVLTPKLMGSFTLNNLIQRYNKLDSAPVRVRDQLWKRYTSHELNQTQQRNIEAHAVLTERRNRRGEPGLYFADQALDEQGDSLSRVWEEYSGDTASLTTMNIASYLIRNAMQLERGKQRQDGTGTSTRFIGLAGRLGGLFGINRLPADAEIWNGSIYLGTDNGSSTLAGNRGIRLAMRRSE